MARHFHVRSHPAVLRKCKYEWD